MSKKLPTYEEVGIKIWDTVQVMMAEAMDTGGRQVMAIPQLAKVLIECIERAKASNLVDGGVQELSDKELDDLLAKAKVVKLEPRNRDQREAG